jgi:hypothetical protein
MISNNARSFPVSGRSAKVLITFSKGHQRGERGNKLGIPGPIMERFPVNGMRDEPGVS